MHQHHAEWVPQKAERFLGQSKLSFKDLTSLISQHLELPFRLRCLQVVDKIEWPKLDEMLQLQRICKYFLWIFCILIENYRDISRTSVRRKCCLSQNLVKPIKTSHRIRRKCTARPLRCLRSDVGFSNWYFLLMIFISRSKSLLTFAVIILHCTDCWIFCYLLLFIIVLLRELHKKLQ